MTRKQIFLRVFLLIFMFISVTPIKMLLEYLAKRNIMLMAIVFFVLLFGYIALYKFLILPILKEENREREENEQKAMLAVQRRIIAGYEKIKKEEEENNNDAKENEESGTDEYEYER